jgi:hypothetical protein
LPICDVALSPSVPSAYPCVRELTSGACDGGAGNRDTDHSSDPGPAKAISRAGRTPRLSEADTKANFIDRYVGALGYDGLEDVVREYYVKNSQEFIDYVLRARGQAVLAIEAKSLSTELTDKHGAQLVQYCSVEGIEWAALTNARALWLFNTFLRGDQNQKLVAKLDLLGFNTDTEFQEIFGQLWLLSKASLSSPSGINSWMEQRRLDQALRGLLLQPRSAPIQAIVADLGVSAGISTTPEAVVHWIRGQLTPALTPLPVEKLLQTSSSGQEDPALGTTRLLKEPRLPLRVGGPRYWMLPCAPAEGGVNAVGQLHRWLDRAMWGLGESTPGRKAFQPGDYLCFYAARQGVAAYARLAGPADTLVTSDEWPEPRPPSAPVYKVPLQDVTWLPAARPIDASVRAQLDAFGGRDLTSNPGWFVQTTRTLSQHDFELLTASKAA